MFYIWLIVFSFITVMVCFPLYLTRQIGRRLLCLEWLFCLILNSISAIVLGLGTENGTFTVKTIIFYFIINYFCGLVAKYTMKKSKVIVCEELLLECVIILTPIIVFSSMELVFSGIFNFRKMEMQYKISNLVILYMIFVEVYYLAFPKKITVILYTIVGVLCSVINYLISGLRNGNAVLPGDVFALRSALNVASNYTIQLPKRVIAILLCVIVFTIIIIFLPSRQHKRRKPIKVIISGAVGAGILYTCYTHIDLTDSLNMNLNYWQISETYTEYGMPLTFLSLCQNMVVEEPQGYSDENAESIYKNNELLTDKSKLMLEKKPTVIVIMNESFCDLSVIGDIESEPDYMPFWKNFDEPVMRGNLLVSAYVGGTCNTEFEFLTGFSMGNLPAGVYPYQLYNLENVSSLPKLFKNLGYETLAIHPGKAATWNRTKAYEDLGFDEFLSEEDLALTESDYMRNCVKDSVCYKELIETYETRKDEMFIFCVTIQNHGGYTPLTFDENEIILLKNELNQYDDVKEYLNLIKISDAELKKLFDYFKNVDDPVVICVFGDHQPGLNENFYNDLYGKTNEMLTIEERTRQYLTPYLIWSNYNIGQKEELDTSANFLGTLLLNKIGVPDNAFNEFLLRMNDNITMMNATYFKTTNGGWHILNDDDSNEWIKRYSIVQYYEMFRKGKG